MTVVWSKYRGPGQVSFDPPIHPAQAVVNGAVTKVHFSEPGVYTLLVVVDDGSGETAGNFGYHCCWTNALVKVTCTRLDVAQRSTLTAPRHETRGVGDDLCKWMEALMLSALRRHKFGRVSLAATVAVGGALLTLVPVLAAIDGNDSTKAVTFSKDVAPIFQAKCQQCHHPGTAAPMSLTTFAEARPWAKSIGLRVASREMPPWHLDKTVGIREYKNDLSLNDQQIATIVAWVAAGAPQGNPADMPKPLTFAPESDWAIGKPDLVISTDETMHMYAKGPDWWISYFANTGLTEDRYIKAVQIKPGNPRIVHHAIAAIVADPTVASKEASSMNMRSGSTGTSLATTRVAC